MSVAERRPPGDPPQQREARALELRTLWKRFGTVAAVAGVDLSVEDGEFVTLLGPSGSGKTTILRLVAGFEQPSSGEIRIGMRNISALPPNKRGIGMVFQNYALFPHMTVAENLRYPLKLHRWRPEAASRRVGEVIELLRLSGLEARRPTELSGGQQQRVAVGRALAFKPPVLLMDEPLGALDRALRTDLQRELRRIHREVGATMLYVTHDQEEALTLSSRIGIMRNGKLLQLGTPRETFEQPADAFVASFLGECNLLPAGRPEIVGDGMVRVEVLQRSLVVPGRIDRTDDVALVLRPSRLRLVDRPGDVVLSGRLVDLVYLGETVRFVANVPGLGSVVGSASADEARQLRGDESVTLAFSERDLACVPRRGSAEGSQRRSGNGEEAPRAWGR